jgi:hypothetical protein
MLLLWVSHVCLALLRCCAASVLAWPTTSGQRNDVSRGHGQAQCHDQNSGVIINVSQVAFPATTGKRISGQPANAPAQPSSSTSPSPGNSGKCIVIADHHQPSFRHGQEPWIASPPPPAVVGQRSGMVSNQHQLAWRGHQNLASAPPKQKPLASAPARLSTSGQRIVIVSRHLQAHRYDHRPRGKCLTTTGNIWQARLLWSATTGMDASMFSNI